MDKKEGNSYVIASRKKKTKMKGQYDSARYTTPPSPFPHVFPHTIYPY